jgi:hypothetical protein
VPSEPARPNACLGYVQPTAISLSKGSQGSKSSAFCAFGKVELQAPRTIPVARLWQSKYAPRIAGLSPAGRERTISTRRKCSTHKETRSPPWIPPDRRDASRFRRPRIGRPGAEAGTTFSSPRCTAPAQTIWRLRRQRRPRLHERGLASPLRALSGLARACRATPLLEPVTSCK